MLSNKLFVSLPLDTVDLVLPAEAYRSHAREGDDAEKTLLPADENLDDKFKEVLKIQPGSPYEGMFLFFIVPPNGRKALSVDDVCLIVCRRCYA